EMLPHDRLRRNQYKRMLDEPSHVVARLVLPAFERIGTQIEQLGCAQRHERLHPDLKAVRRLFHEYDFVLIVAKAGQIAVVGPVEKFTTLVSAFARKQIALVVAVQVHLEGLSGSTVTLKQLVLDVRLAGCCNERRDPILGQEDIVDLGMRLDKIRPPNKG